MKSWPNPRLQWKRMRGPLSRKPLDQYQSVGDVAQLRKMSWQSGAVGWGIGGRMLGRGDLQGSEMRFPGDSCGEILLDDGLVGGSVHRGDLAEGLDLRGVRLIERFWRRLVRWAPRMCRRSSSPKERATRPGTSWFMTPRRS